MAIISQVDTLTRGIQIEQLLRTEPRRAVDLAAETGLQIRAIQRLLSDLQEVGAWRRKRGLPWYEMSVEVRGRERYHRITDHPAEPQKVPRR